MDLPPPTAVCRRLGRYRRSVHLTDTGLTLRDETDYPGTVALTLMSVEKPAVDGDTVRIRCAGRCRSDRCGQNRDRGRAHRRPPVCARPGPTRSTAHAFTLPNSFPLVIELKETK